MVKNHFEEEEFSTLKIVRAVEPEEFPRKFRVAVRVIDYEPQNFRDWIHRFCKRCQEAWVVYSRVVFEGVAECISFLHSLVAPQKKCSTCGNADLMLSYRFALLVRDDEANTIVVACDGVYAVSPSTLLSFLNYFVDMVL